MTTTELRQQLASSRERLLRAIAGVTEEQFKRRPRLDGADEQSWSIAEVLSHLLASERLRASRIRTALEQDGAVITPSAPESHEETARAGRVAPVPQLVHGLLASRREVDLLLQRASEINGGLDRAVDHPVQGRQTIEWMAREKVLAHELEHFAQIEVLRTAVGAPPLERPGVSGGEQR